MQTAAASGICRASVVEKSPGDRCLVPEGWLGPEETELASAWPPGTRVANPGGARGCWGSSI
eukprot:9936993-Alexandrium_andersonii.AAC.1